jgi:hypothetical protein
MTQAQLDLLCAVDSGDECKSAKELSAGSSEHDVEAMSHALYASKRRRRISFSGMGAEISALAADRSNIPPEDMDLRGGFTQAALDGMMVADEACSRDDSPVSTSLRRKKRSRVSVGGAGVQNMISVASDTLAQEIPSVSAETSTCGSPRKFARSPRKARAPQKDNENMPAPGSPVKKVMRAPDKSMFATPPRETMSLTPLSPLNA